MSIHQPTLADILDGWNGYQTSLANAIAPLTAEQLRWRPTANHRSVGELARHISLGRVTWFARMDAPLSQEVAAQIPAWEQDDDGNRDVVESALAISEQAAALVDWLALTWRMIETTLQTWSVADLHVSYRHQWNGDIYDVSRQWTIWRILSHDLHHGGELSLMLGMQGIEAFELSELFGHIILPALASDA